MNDALAACVFLLRGRKPKDGLTVLCYHRLAGNLPAGAPYNAYNVDPAVFERQINELCGMADVNVVAIRDVLAWLEEGLPTKGSHVLLTFDDGWQHGTRAAELLGSKGLAAVFFIATGYMGKPVFEFSPYDRWCSQLANADPDWFTPLADHDCLTLRRLGMDVQPHGHRHYSLGKMSEAEMKEDIRCSLNYVRDKLGEDAKTFCYPFGSSYLGDVTDAVEFVLRGEGVRLAFSTDAGNNLFSDLRRRPLRLRRIPINDYDRGILFEAKAAGYCGILPWLKLILHRLQNGFARVMKFYELAYHQR